jgi:DNA-binding response OmpR family regulator
MEQNNNKKILIVEDEESLRNILKDALEQKGFSCKSSENGKNGLEMSYSEKPDLIVLDLLMPEMDGMTMLQELRKDAWGSTAKVLILTNLSVDNHVHMKDILTTVPECYLIKSDWAITEIVNKIENII